MQNKSESGRTMLETLAVIAIIILLGIFAICWFKGALARQEADRDYEDIMTNITSVYNRGTKRTNKGIADTLLAYNKTRSGKPLSILYNCPQDTTAIAIKIDDIDERTCRYLMEKDWGSSYKPLFFLRGEMGQNVCTWNGDQAGLYRLAISGDCTRAGSPEKGSFTVVFNDKKNSLTLCNTDEDCDGCDYCGGDGICKKCICNNVGILINETCTCQNGYIGDECETYGYTECLINSDCTDSEKTSYAGKNTYCKLTSVSEGKCVSKGDASDFIEITLPDGFTKVYASNKPMIWFAAIQYCQAHGMTSASKNLFTGVNTPDSNSHLFYTLFQEKNRSGVWYWLNENKIVNNAEYGYTLKCRQDGESVTLLGYAYGQGRPLCVK